jgi:hypothetical protein
MASYDRSTIEIRPRFTRLMLLDNKYFGRECTSHQRTVGSKVCLQTSRQFKLTPALARRRVVTVGGAPYITGEFLGERTRQFQVDLEVKLRSAN